MVAYFGLLTSRSQKRRVVSVDAAVMLIALVGFSRMYLDAHYISDVVGGCCWGAWSSAVIGSLKSARRRDKANLGGQGRSP